MGGHPGLRLDHPGGLGAHPQGEGGILSRPTASFRWFERAVYLAAAALVLYIAYLLLWPITVVELTHTPIALREHTLRPGQELHYVLEYCKHHDIPAAVEFTLLGGAAVPTLTSYRNLPLACPGRQELGVVIPLSTLPGRYRVVLVNRYRINQLRTDTNTWETEAFEVVRP